MTVWITRGKNQMRIMRRRKMELCCESCDQMMTGCRQMKGWMMVRMTNRVVRASMCSVLEAKCSRRKRKIGRAHV